MLELPNFAEICQMACLSVGRCREMGWIADNGWCVCGFVCGFALFLFCGDLGCLNFLGDVFFGNMVNEA